jgi:hypothetical protein
MTRRVSSYRLSEHTLAQIAALATGMGSAANVITIAVDRLHSQERTSMKTEITVQGGLTQVWEQFMGGYVTPQEFLATSMDANISAVEQPTISEIVHAAVQDMPRMYSDWEYGDPDLLYIHCTNGRSGYLSELLTELINETRDNE